MQKKIHKHPQKRDWDQLLKNRSLYNAYRGVLSAKNTDLGGGSLLSHPHKMVCLTCREAHKLPYRNEKCAVCGSDLVLVASRVRIPRKLASNRIWNRFTKRFCTQKGE